MILPLVLLAVLFVCSSTALAQSGTVLDLGGGISTFNDSSGRSGTIFDLGGGLKTYSDNRGVTGTILDLGGGLKSYHFTPPPKPLTPLVSPPAYPRLEFDDTRHQRDDSFFNPSNPFQGIQ